MTWVATIAAPRARKPLISSLVEEAAPDISNIADLLAIRYRLAPVSSDVLERSVSRISGMAPDSGAAWPNIALLTTNRRGCPRRSGRA